jgi:hypothetical protein
VSGRKVHGDSRGRALIGAALAVFVALAMLPSGALAANGKGKGNGHGNGKGKQTASSGNAKPNGKAHGNDCAQPPCGLANGHEGTSTSGSGSYWSNTGGGDHSRGNTSGWGKSGGRNRSRDRSKKNDSQGKGPQTVVTHATEVARREGAAIERALRDPKMDWHKAGSAKVLGSVSIYEPIRHARRSSGDKTIDRVGAAIDTARQLGFPLVLALMVILFLILHSRIDRLDPKLADAARTAEQETLGFV